MITERVEVIMKHMLIVKGSWASDQSIKNETIENKGILTF